MKEVEGPGDIQTLLSLIGRTSMDGFLAWDNRDRIIFSNRAAERIAGYEPGELAGKLRVEDLFAPDSMAVLGECLRGSPPGEDSEGVECRVLSKAGEEILVLVSLSAVSSLKGHMPGILCFIRDLRETKKMEKVSEDAKREAILARSIGEMAHYIKNILNKLEGGLYMVNTGLRRSREDITARGWNMVEKNVTLIADLAMNLLNYSKSHGMESEAGSANVIAGDFLDLLRDKYQGSDIEMEKVPAPEVETSLLDLKGIQRCLLNVAAYVVDAFGPEPSKEKDRRIIIRAFEDGETAGFDVIAKSLNLDRIPPLEPFESFLHSVRSHGPGFGLLVAHDIAKANGGSLTAVKGEDGELRFCLRFPRKPV